MNHNYYYALLGKRAGGIGAQAGCTSTSRWIRTSFGNTGYVGDVTNAADNLAFGNTFEVWTQSTPGWPLVEGASRLYTDSALTQQLVTSGSGWFQIEDQLFRYDVSSGPTQITPTNLPLTSDQISAGDSSLCSNLGGPFQSQIWANSNNWQTVTKVWTDAAQTQLFQGGGLWYSIEGNSISAMGTTIQINNCGQVTALYAC